MRRLSYSVFLGLLSSSSAFATDLTYGPPGGLYVLPAMTPMGQAQNTVYSGFIGDSSLVYPTWRLAQFNNPLPIPYTTSPSAPVPPVTNWSVGNQTTTVKFYAMPQAGILEHTYELSQNGSVAGSMVPCVPNPGYEYDLFLAATSYGYTTPQGAAAPYTFASSGPVGALNSLGFNLGLNITYERTIAGGCSFSAAVYDVAVNLTDKIGHTISWQVELRDSLGRILNNVHNSDPMHPMHDTFTSSIDQVVTGQPQQQANATRIQYINIQFLSQLKNAIAMVSADPDPNNWTIANIYMGSAINGPMVVTSRWDGLTLMAY